ncbi:MAG TPA: hypothetical protein VEO00_05450 [Actinomycetota bacterium]|nr:hypothetical protein [Actinomycetota bacterium]
MRLRWCLALLTSGSVLAALAGPASAGAGGFTKPFPTHPAHAAPFGPETIRAATSGGGRVPTNINASRKGGNQSEQTISVNPTNPNNVVIISNDEAGAGVFEAYTFDGGVTWTRTEIADGDNLGNACCDAQGSFDTFGNYFFVYLGTGVQVGWSTDGGATFRPAFTVATGGVDQPSLATGANSVWVSWNQSGVIKARGAKVTGLGTIGTVGGMQNVPNANGSFGDTEVGPNGEVAVVYQNPYNNEGPSTVYVNVDPDGVGGAGFGPRVTVTTTNVGGFDYIPAQSGRSVDSETDLEWDRSTSAFRGRLYLIYTEETAPENNNTEILLRYSDNNGATWSGSVRVNDDATTRSQFLPKPAVDQTTGKLAVGWHDARNDAGNHGPGDTNGVANDDAQFWGAVSGPGGTSFGANFQISVGTSNDNDANSGVDYGDYIGLDANAGVFWPAWADNSNSTGDNPNGTLNQFDVYTAKVAM